MVQDNPSPAIDNPRSTEFARESRESTRIKRWGVLSVTLFLRFARTGAAPPSARKSPRHAARAPRLHSRPIKTKDHVSLTRSRDLRMAFVGPSHVGLSACRLVGLSACRLAGLPARRQATALQIQLSLHGYPPPHPRFPRIIFPTRGQSRRADRAMAASAPQASTRLRNHSVQRAPVPSC